MVIALSTACVLLSLVALWGWQLRAEALSSRKFWIGQTRTLEGICDRKTVKEREAVIDAETQRAKVAELQAEIDRLIADHAPATEEDDEDGYYLTLEDLTVPWPGYPQTIPTTPFPPSVVTWPPDALSEIRYRNTTGNSPKT